MLADAPIAKLQLTEKLEGLFRPKRYKVLHGGRGGGKSWAVAATLLVMAADRTMRILCAREVQKSMRDSVHRLLKDTIERLGLSMFYDVLDTEIRGANGSLFVFTGLQAHTVDSIKSFEGVDIVWIEEAHSVSKRSWDVLIPTIRKEGSELWMTLNPDMDTDETYRRFIETPSADTWVCQVNWWDNPWFPEVLDQERQKAKRSQSAEDYEHIWEGKPRTVAEGAIYRHEIQALYADGRVRDVPYDPTLPVHTIWDLGWNDAMTIGFAQRGPMDVRFIDYIEDSHRTLDWYVAQIEKRPYRWGHDYLPHDGRSRNFQTGKSTEEQLRAMGRKPIVLPQTSVEEGIKAVRMMFPRCYFDKTRTGRLLECLKRYRRALHTQTNEPMAPLHDEFSHGCLVGDTLVVTDRGEVPIVDVLVGDKVWTPAGFAVVLNSGPTKVATELIEITMEGGRVLIATPEHKIFTTRGVVLADALRYDDCMFNQESHLCLPSQSIESMGYRDALTESFKANVTGSGQIAGSTSVRSAENSDYFTWRSMQRYMARHLVGGVSALRMATTAMSILKTGLRFASRVLAKTPFKRLTECASTGSHRAITKRVESIEVEFTCTDTYGSATTAPYQTGCTSITRTATKPITTSATWSFLRHPFIQSITGKIIRGLGAKKIESSLEALPSLQSSGTQVKKGVTGTQKTRHKRGESAKESLSFASNAENGLKHRGQQGLSSATRIARLRRFEPEEKTIVYDLTVEKHHCYVANGVLVSNSDMFRYAGQAVPVMPNVMEQAYDEPPPPDWRT